MNIKHNQRGFTIIELLIATTVFSMILLLASNAVVQIGRLYYKGLTTTRTQEATRQVTEDVARSLQLSKKGDMTRSDDTGKPVDASKAVCIGDTRYTYVLDKEIGVNTRHAVWTDQAPDTGACDALDMSSNLSGGKELLGDSMRLLKFSIVQNGSTGTYSIGIIVAYGDNDLLTHYDETGTSRLDVTSDGLINEADFATGLCRSGISGSNFCAVSGLDTTIKRRIN